MTAPDAPHTVFHGERRLVTAPLEGALAFLAALADRLDPTVPLVVVDDHSGRAVDFDLRGGVEDVLRRALPDPAAPRARPPRAARIVTLLPRHWAWLDAQEGGADAALRRLLDGRTEGDRASERVLAARTAAHRFIAALAGDRPGAQDASSALFAGRAADFERATRAWPDDVRAHALHLAAPAFPPDPEDP